LQTGATLAMTLLALLAFAANSLLCRAALRPGLVDPASFTSMRLAAGAVALMLISRARARRGGGVGGSWTSGAVLFTYAIAFSLAYLRLDAGTGALILFGSVQAAMIGWGIAKGSRPRVVEWLGTAVALCGLVVLTRPGFAAPDPRGALLMALAGAAWGAYSIVGRDAADPVASNAGNFVRAVPLALGVSLLACDTFQASVAGAGLAVASGAITSGVGYAFWYSALRGLSATRAAVVQLAVPVLAAAGGVAFLDERIGLRFVAAAALVLGGIGLALTARARG
jgi:drug/metabolite transporter (DMT)-like permease